MGIDEETPLVRALEVTTSAELDAPMLPELLDQIPSDQDIGSVTVDGAHDTQKCHDAIAARNAHAFGHSLEAVVFVSSRPPRKNAKAWKPASAGGIARNAAVNAPR